jgi:hypothetical protein
MEFRFSASARITSYVFSVLLFAGGIFLIGYTFFGHVYGIFIGPFLIGIGWFLLKEVKSSCLILNDDSITLINSKSFKTLPLADIKGFRKLDKGNIEILPAPGTLGKMTISSSFENRQQIEAWLREHIPDIDAVTVEEETKSILADEHFGFSETDRVQRLKQAKQTAKLLNAAGLIIGLWGFIYPTPYNILIVLSLLFPLIAFVVIWYFKGLVQLADGKKSAYPSAAGAFLMPSLLLMVRALLDYEIYDYSFYYKPFVILLVIALAVAWWSCREMIKYSIQKPVTLITLLIALCCYSYGAVTVINGYYDETPGKVFAVPVKDKHISTGKHTSYYLLVDTWGRYTSPKEVSVSPNLYNAENPGDTVNVYLKNGYLGIPWFWVGSKDGQ